MSEKTYEFSGDDVLDFLTVANAPFVRQIVIKQTITPDDVGKVALVLDDEASSPPIVEPVLVYNPFTGKFRWVLPLEDLEENWFEVTARLVKSLSLDTLLGLEPAVQEWIGQVSDPRQNIAVGIQLCRLAARLPAELVAETGIRDLIFRVLDAGRMGAKL